MFILRSSQFNGDEENPTRWVRAKLRIGHRTTMPSCRGVVGMECGRAHTVTRVGVRPVCAHSGEIGVTVAHPPRIGAVGGETGFTPRRSERAT